MKEGLITKLIAGQYVVYDKNLKEEFNAIARGRFRSVVLDEESSFNKPRIGRSKTDKKTIQLSPKVGDRVLYSVDIESGNAIIEEIKERKNDLVRPDVSNVDQVLLLFSSVKPDFSFLLLDKFLLILAMQNLNPIIIVTKIDLIEDSVLSDLKTKLNYYENYYDVYYVNSKQKIGFDTLTHIFKNKISVLAGQTGVGKSTLLNALMPELNIKTQEISKALNRGKHTTRHSELYQFNEGHIADTPGFSKIELSIEKPEDIKEFYKDFAKYQNECRFGNSCNHINEPSCAVKEAVKSGEIIEDRYNNYISFYEEIKNQKIRY